MVVRQRPGAFHAGNAANASLPGAFAHANGNRSADHLPVILLKDRRDRHVGWVNVNKQQHQNKITLKRPNIVSTSDETFSAEYSDGCTPLRSHRSFEDQRCWGLSESTAVVAR